MQIIRSDADGKRYDLLVSINESDMSISLEVYIDRDELIVSFPVNEMDARILHGALSLYMKKNRIKSTFLP